MALSKLGTRARRFIGRDFLLLSLGLSLLAYHTGLAHSESVQEKLKVLGGIAGLMSGCDSDSSGLKKIEQLLAKPNGSLYRPYLDKSFMRAMLENVIEVNGQEMKLPCDELKSSGNLVILKQSFNTDMDIILRAP